MHILLIENNVEHQRLIASFFKRIYDNCYITVYSNLETGIRQISGNRFNLCFCNLAFPESTEEHTLSAIQALNSEVPVIVLTQAYGQALEQKLAKYGLPDYLPVGEISEWTLSRMSQFALARKQSQLDAHRKEIETDAFSYALSHDINGALSRISSLVRLLAHSVNEDSGLNADAQKMLTFIQKNTDTVKDFVESLYTYLSIDSGVEEEQKFDLWLVVNNAIAAVKDLTGKTFDVTLDGGHYQVIGCPKQIRILFIKLIHNAVHYNENTPCIRVTARQMADDKVTITIADNGIGIPPQELKSIFMLFKRSHAVSQYTGSGLGLPIAEKVAKNNNGRITVTSTCTEGSAFTVALPISL